MQPLVRFVPRFFSGPITSLASSRALRVHNQSLLRASSCLQCRIRSQRRLLTNVSKPSDPTQPPNASNFPPSGESSSQAEKSTSPTSAEYVPENLPSEQEGRRSALNQRLSHLMDNLQGNIFIASQRINDLTGYSGIEALKSRIVALESRVQEAQEAVRSSRLTYKTTVADRAATQREVTTLLARKDSWSPTDLERFTSLYRMDHSNEQAVQEAATRLADAEREAETTAGQLSSNILSRYHEEQIWSDKIRRMSTWGTWGLMGVNILLFLVFQLGFEPWRRKRLVRGFEEKVLEALEQGKEAQAAGKEIGRAEGGKPTLNKNAGVAAQAIEEEMRVSTTHGPETNTIFTTQNETSEQSDPRQSIEVDRLSVVGRLRQPYTWQATAKDLFSKRSVQMRKQDVTIIALEGAATGAAIVALVATLLRPS